jgi:hypothetical protein
MLTGMNNEKISCLTKHYELSQRDLGGLTRCAPLFVRMYERRAGGRRPGTWGSLQISELPGKHPTVS